MPKGQLRSHRIHILLTPAEHDVIAEVCKRGVRAPASIARDLLIAWADRVRDARGGRSGGACATDHCADEGATWWNRRARNFVCEDCATRFNAEIIGVCVAECPEPRLEQEVVVAYLEKMTQTDEFVRARQELIADLERALKQLRNEQTNTSLTPSTET